MHEHPGGPFSFCDGATANGSAAPVVITHDVVHDHFRRTLAGSKWSKMRGGTAYGTVRGAGFGRFGIPMETVAPGP